MKILDGQTTRRTDDITEWEVESLLARSKARLKRGRPKAGVDSGLCHREAVCTSPLTAIFSLRFRAKNPLFYQHVWMSKRLCTPGAPAFTKAVVCIATQGCALWCGVWPDVEPCAVTSEHRSLHHNANNCVGESWGAGCVQGLRLPPHPFLRQICWVRRSLGVGSGLWYREAWF